MQTIKSVWEGKLQSAIQHVNVAFSRFFAFVAYPGEVSLQKPALEYDFDKWGIGIKVQFRESDTLSFLSLKNSGGERAVTTMLFLMALQGVLPNPFRVVDEINQVRVCLSVCLFVCLLLSVCLFVYVSFSFMYLELTHCVLCCCLCLGHGYEQRTPCHATSSA